MIEPEGIPPTLRARLATESRLTQRQNELKSANRKITDQARKLTDEVIRRREEAMRAKSEVDALRGKNRAALLNLRRAASETRMAERRLWASVESIEDGFAVFDGDRKISAANRAFFRPFADLECVRIGTTYDELVDIAAEEGLVDPGDMTPRQWAWWMKSRWDARHIEPVTVRFYNDRFVRLSERITEDGDMVMLAVNMTRAMRREKTLQEARNKAEAASRAKSAFLANISHEIRTPMNGVLAMAELLAEGELDADQALCVDTIRSSGEALLVIINEVLDYSKIEARKLQLVEEPF
ncbi:MAG: histidine kinase dimerization/phospho-acceptor domain-containing protein, partial [Pseudomonadota bacterium]